MSVVNRGPGRHFDNPTVDALLGETGEVEIGPKPHELVDTTEPAFGHITRILLDLAHAGMDLSDEAIVRKAIATGRRDHADHVQGEHHRAGLRSAKLERDRHPSVVYYMRVGNRVKIGYSTNLTARVSAVVPEEVLATEPGGRLLEEIRHRQFGDLHVTREWFRLEQPLIAHISKLARAS